MSIRTGWRWRTTEEHKTTRDRRRYSVQKAFAKHQQHAGDSYPGPLSYFCTHKHDRQVTVFPSNLRTCVSHARLVQSQASIRYAPAPQPPVGPMAIRRRRTLPQERPDWLIGAGDGQYVTHTSYMLCLPSPTHFQSSLEMDCKGVCWFQVQYPPWELVKYIQWFSSINKSYIYNTATFCQMKWTTYKKVNKI